MTERLQKIISSAGITSRRRAEELIAAGRVTVNGARAVLGQRADPDSDAIAVDGIPLRIDAERTYIMLNKPRGYVTTLSDEKGRPGVNALVAGAGKRLYPVGRLDMYSEGLLIMTDDGAAANALMHPSHRVVKTYHAWVRGPDVSVSVARLRQPMTIDGYRIWPVDAVLLSETGGAALLAISISEGRNRQVRKMCAAVDLRVVRLLRVAQGSLKLGDLPPGKWRYLTPEETAYIRSIG